MTNAPRIRTAAPLAAATVTYAILSTVLPSGLPFGVVLLGLVMGGLSALTAIGLVLIHRASRVVNFAQAEIGGLAASVVVVLVVAHHLPYVVVVPVGLAVAVATGAVVDLTVVRRLANAPRLILTVATIGVAQILAGAELEVPHLFGHLSALTTFRTPFSAHVSVGPIVFTADHLVAVATVAGVAAGFWVFLSRSDLGTAVRGAAESSERALLLGIPVRRLSTLVWALAGGLSGLGAVLSVPILGPSLGVTAGPEALLAPLAAAVVAGMDSLPGAVAAALGIGVVQQAVFWSYPRASTVDIVLFAVVLVGLFGRRRRPGGADADVTTHVAVRPVRPIPREIARLPKVRAAGAAALIALGLLVLAPFTLSGSRLLLLAFMAIYAIVAVSLVVLSGWAGQISLGQFAFAGLGAATTGSLLVNAHADLFVALAAATAVGALVAVVVGLPALRIRGLLLAVTTLAFAVPVSTYLLNATYVPWFAPSSVPRPRLFSHVDLSDGRTFYYFCVAGFVAVAALARNFRRSRPGRALIAVRDNERAAAAFAIGPTRVKLGAFALSGSIAGFAGGLYVLGVRGVSYGSFPAVKSLQIFTMVVVGGLGSLWGAVLGAVYVQGAEYFLHGGAQLLATGAGLLGLLLVLPGGLGDLVFRVRDHLLRAVAGSAGGDVATNDFPVEPPPRSTTTTAAAVGPAVLAAEGLEASYDARQILFGVDLAVGEGEILAVLGTNGAGKSTLLRAIAGVVPAQRGRICLAGDDLSNVGPVGRVQRGLCLAPGGRGVFASLSVAENLRLAGWSRRRAGATVERDTARALELFPVLGERLADPAGVLSGGEQQMLTLAQALIARPRVLLVDELSLGLAPDVTHRLFDVLRAMSAEGTTIVLVEQSAQLAATIATRAVFMDRGQIRFCGLPAELLRRGDLLRPVFLEPAVAARSNGHRRVHAPSRPRLEVAGVRKAFGGVQALGGVDLQVPPETIVGVIGPNGAGKSTLFDVCSGFVAADAGQIVLDGRDVTRLSPAARAAAGLGRSFQDARLFPSMTVAEAVATACERHVRVRDPFACMLRLPAVGASERAVAQRARSLLAGTGLLNSVDTFVSELSTGMRRILDIACALAHEPAVLLLDEPSSGVAGAECGALGELLLELRARSGASLLVVEHDIGLVAAIADELVCMNLGHVIAHGAPTTVLSDPAVVRSYPSASSPTSPTMTTAEYARAAGLSVSSVLRRIRTGELDAVRKGRGYRIPVPS